MSRHPSLGRPDGTTGPSNPPHTGEANVAPDPGPIRGISGVADWRDPDEDDPRAIRVVRYRLPEDLPYVTGGWEDKPTLWQMVAALVDRGDAEALARGVLSCDHSARGIHWTASDEAWSRRREEGTADEPPTIVEVIRAALDEIYPRDGVLDWPRWPRKLLAEIRTIIADAWQDEHDHCNRRWDANTCPAITKAGTRCKNRRGRCPAHQEPPTS